MRARTGRFREPPAPALEAYADSTPEDAALLRHDVAGSIAHVRVLEDAGLLAPGEADDLAGGLRAVHRRLRDGQAHLDPAHEDVHMNVEALLADEVGDLADRLHAGRSRNDQVALDVALWTRERSLDLALALLEAQAALLDAADAHADTPAAGETHGRPAQPLPFGALLAAHAAALGRDAERAVRAAHASDRSPLGAGALAGTTLATDPALAADLLALDGVVPNPVDAVGARDAAADALAAAAQAGTHLSRLGADLAAWSHPRTGAATLPEAYTTGSSLMPHKANPDAAELLRARAAPAAGALADHHAVVAGLPAGYHRDLQEAKRVLLEALPPVTASARLASDLVAGATFHPPPPTEAGGDAVLATDVAERLVAEGVPFRRAHDRVGDLVRRAEDEGVPFADLVRKELDLDLDLDAAALLEHRGPHADPEAVRDHVADLRGEAADLRDRAEDRLAEARDAVDALLHPPEDDAQERGP